LHWRSIAKYDEKIIEADNNTGNLKFSNDISTNKKISTCKFVSSIWLPFKLTYFVRNYTGQAGTIRKGLAADLVFAVLPKIKGLL